MRLSERVGHPGWWRSHSGLRIETWCIRRLESDTPHDKRALRVDHGAPGFEAAASAEVGVGFVDPVFAGWGEDVEGQGVFEGDGGVGDASGDDEDLAGFDDADVAFSEVEAEGAGDDVADLLVGVGVAGDDAAFGEVEAGEHGLLSVDELALEEGV